MQEKASEMQAQSSAGSMLPPPPLVNSESSDEGIKDLIDSVASGTASDSDIETLTAKLKEMATYMQNSSSTSETSSDSEMESLMAKIADGTATDADVKAIATLMKANDDSTSMAIGTPPPKPPEDTSSVTSSSSSSTDAILEMLSAMYADSTDSSSNSSDTTSSGSVKNINSAIISQQLLDSFMEAYSLNYSDLSTSTQSFSG